MILGWGHRAAPVHSAAPGRPARPPTAPRAAEDAEPATPIRAVPLGRVHPPDGTRRVPPWPQPPLLPPTTPWPNASPPQSKTTSSVAAAGPSPPGGPPISPSSPASTRTTRTRWHTALDMPRSVLLRTRGCTPTQPGHFSTNPDPLRRAREGSTSTRKGRVRERSSRAQPRQPFDPASVS